MQLHARIRKICKHYNVSQKKLAESLGLRQPQFNGYLNSKSQRNLWQYLPEILQLFPMVSRKWLYFGEEEMLSPGTTSRNTLPAASPLLCREMPLLGFADSQLNMSPVKELAKDTVSVSLSIHSIAVKAGGNSMFPAGIQHGHICYCDPDAKPVVDEPVFAMNKLKQGFIKVYLGQSRKEDCTSFKSWNDEHGHFSPHYTDIPNELLELVAPVIFIRLKY